MPVVAAARLEGDVKESLVIYRRAQRTNDTLLAQMDEYTAQTVDSSLSEGKEGVSYL